MTPRPDWRRTSTTALSGISMAHARNSSEATVKTPHSLSLKVLRLSRPLLAQQVPLPPLSSSNPYKINPAAALASHSPVPDQKFLLSPLLSLPSSFGTLHVGETFTCTLCANNELTADLDHGSTITNVRIMAEMTTPSSLEPIPLELDAADGADSTAASSLTSGETMQRIMRYYLREEGTHVLAITLTYTEGQSQSPELEIRRSSSSAGSRTRTFRKLYQFAAQSLMSVRTKIRTVPATVLPNNSKTASNSFALEAQLENCSDGIIVLDHVEVLPRQGIESTSLNAWELPHREIEPFENKPTIMPGDVVQVAYILNETADLQEDQLARIRKEATGLCQLHIAWKGTMGEEGALTTAWLGGKRR